MTWWSRKAAGLAIASSKRSKPLAARLHASRSFPRRSANSANGVRMKSRRCVGARSELPEGAPIVVYPGDLEVSQGAESVARAVATIARELPEAVVVFACRFKTVAAPAVERAAPERLDPRSRSVRPDQWIFLLCSRSRRSVLFPVDDLWGKVDLPIALLEAMRLGVPIVTLDQGPLTDLEGVLPGPGRRLRRARARRGRDRRRRHAPASSSRRRGQMPSTRRFDAPTGRRFLRAVFMSPYCVDGADEATRAVERPAFCPWCSAPSAG